MRTFNICMIHGDKIMDHMAHHFDVFEPFKRLAMPTLIEADCENENPDLLELCMHLKETCENTGHFVVAIFVINTAIGWIDSSCKVISNGQGFITLRDALDSYHYQGEIDDQRSEVVGSVCDSRV